MKIDRTVFCHAEGTENSWQAFCVDFDLAVQGRSFDEVYRKLNEQIALYLDGVMSLPASDRARLLRRRAPLTTWLPSLVRAFWKALSRSGGSAVHNYTYPIGSDPATA